MEGEGYEDIRMWGQLVGETNLIAIAVALFLGFVASLTSWTLRRVGEARDREMQATATLSEVRTKLSHVVETLIRLDTRIDDQEELQRGHAMQVHQDLRELSTEIAEVRAVLDAHIEWEKEHEHGG